MLYFIIIFIGKSLFQHLIADWFALVKNSIFTTVTWEVFGKTY